MSTTPSGGSAEIVEDYGIVDDEVGLCECGKETWDMCDCGAFFEEWICGMDGHGQCSMAGSEECDFECPVMRDLRQRRKPSP